MSDRLNAEVKAYREQPFKIPIKLVKTDRLKASLVDAEGALIAEGPAIKIRWLLDAAIQKIKHSKVV